MRVSTPQAWRHYVGSDFVPVIGFILISVVLPVRSGEQRTRHATANIGDLSRLIVLGVFP